MHSRIMRQPVQRHGDRNRNVVCEGQRKDWFGWSQNVIWDVTYNEAGKINWG